MKKIFFILLLITFTLHVKSQVGINTSNPQAAFHIDGAKDNPSSGTPSITEQANDFAITSEGRVGIGDIQPSSKLYVNGSVATPYRTVNNADVTLGMDDYTVVVTGSGNTNVHLPDASTCKGRMYTIINASSGSLFYRVGGAMILVNIPTLGGGTNVINSSQVDVLQSSGNSGVYSWVKISEPKKNIYDSNGTLAGNRTVITGANFLRFANGTSIVGISNSANEGRLTATGSSRGSLGLAAGTSNLDIYQDSGSTANITTSNSSTGMSIATLNATPITVSTNNTSRMTVTSAGNIGIGTVEPTAQLQTTGNMILGSAASTNGGTGFSTLVRDNTTGEIKAASTSSGNTFAFNYATYQLNNVAQDWVNDFNTNISTSQYTVAVIGSTFDIGSAGLVANAGTYTPLNVFAFQSGGTWHLSADYKNGGTSNGANGNWTIFVLVINNTVVKSLGTVTSNLGGSNGGSAGAPAGL